MHINYSFRGDNSAATFIEKHKVKHGVSKWWVTKNYLMKQCYETSLSQHMEKLLDVPKAPCRSAPFSLIHDGSHHKFAPICVGLAHEFHMLWEKMFHKTILWNFHRGRTLILSKLRENKKCFRYMHPHTHMRVCPTHVGATLMWVWGCMHPKHLIPSPKLHLNSS